MTVRFRVILASLALGLALAAAGAAEAQYARPAQAVINRARAASGGAAWNYLRGWHETGTDGGQAYERWLDPLRYGMRVETHEAAGVATHGFNGAGDWRITAAGAVTGVVDHPVVAAARAEDFYGVYGIFYSGRFDARGKLLGTRRANGKAYDVLQIDPWGAASRELWFDKKTGLLARMVERGAGGKTVTVELSDYRKTGPLKVAFRTVTDDGVGGPPRVRQIERLDFAAVDRSLFSLPRPDSAKPDAAKPDAPPKLDVPSPPRR